MCPVAYGDLQSRVLFMPCWQVLHLPVATILSVLFQHYFCKWHMHDTFLHAEDAVTPAPGAISRSGNRMLKDLEATKSMQASG